MHKPTNDMGYQNVQICPHIRFLLIDKQVQFSTYQDIPTNSMDQSPS